MGFDGNRAPVSLSMTYNANDADYKNTAGFGRGWRTNFSQIVKQWEENPNYYIWTDGDGTDHYFKYESANTYKDEDGLELTLTVNSKSTDRRYVITDKYGNTTSFDNYNRLRYIENNQQTKSTITLTYKTFTVGNGLINTITDGAGRKYQFFYSNAYATNVVYYGTGSEVLEEVRFTYSNSNLTAITDIDGVATSYVYNSGNILSSAADLDGYKLNFTYHPTTASFQPYRVASVTETHNGATGNAMSFTYATNQTTLTDSLDNVIIQQYNDWGNVVSVQDDQGKAQFGAYARGEVGLDTEPTGKNNQLLLSSKMQNTVSNLLTDSSFESNDIVWYPLGTYDTDYTNVTTEHYLGNKALRIPAGDTATTAEITVEPGETYNFSAFVKTGSTTAYLALEGMDGGETRSDTLAANSDWTRLQVSYTNTREAAETARLLIFNLGENEVYVDCVQLEKAPTASRYNLIQNGDFRNGATGWTGTGLADTDGVATMAADAPQLDDNAYKLTGKPEAQKRITQTVNVSGSAGDNYVISGWAKGDSVPLHSDERGREFGIKLSFNYTETFTPEEGQTDGSAVARFNPDVGIEEDAGGNPIVRWQYTAAAAVAKAAYDSITVELIYDYNANDVYFDGIMLFKEIFGTSYTYDEDGNVISVVDLQNKNTTYEYDEDGNLTQILQDNKAKMTYDYDDYHNVISAISEEGLSYAFEYDDYGNNTKVSILEPLPEGSAATATSISSKATYSSDGNRLVSTEDALGNVTLYDYDVQTNVLNWVQYPEDTEATRTNYTYDNMYRVATAAATTDTGHAMSAGYSYTDDYLTQIQTPSTTYNFTYGDFGLRESVKVGTQNLATYDYDSHNRLEKLDYGNDSMVEYTYDEQSRLVKEAYEDGSTVSYTYDNTGALATVTDSETGITTTYYYDLIDRLVKYEEKRTNFTHSVTYIYDEKNNLSSLTEVINGVKTVYTYAYDNDNRVTSVTVGNGTTVISTVTYTYDAFGRITDQVTKHGDSTVLNKTATFTDPSATSTSGQIASYNGFTYTYDANGNITSVAYGGKTTTYEYDSANQLIRENNQQLGITQTWTYDNAGNIQNRKEYAYTTIADLTNTTPTDTVAYTYGNSNWGDLLTAYDGTAITYDNMGNPLTDGTWSYTWQHGRQLASMSNGSTTWTYTYNSDGMRTQRTNGSKTYNYIYNGSQLAQMTVGSDTLTFAYDAAGIPLTVTHNGTVYYYVTNVQGDVVSILDSAGNPVDGYTYDAWGNQSTDSGTSTIGALNPLRYRGYVYDTETGLYYLQSRYYDPEIGRFINADNYPTTGQDFAGNNMFAYCGNNPVSRSDDGGEFWNLVIGAVVGAVVGAVTTAVKEIQQNGWDALTSGKTWAKIGVSAACGAINGTVAASGAHVLLGGVVGGATGFVESLSHELIDHDGDVDEVNWGKVSVDTASGFIGGLAGGNGAMYGNKYMTQQTTRFFKHIATDGIKKAGAFYLKMTVNYSKQFISSTLMGLAKGWVGGQVTNFGLSSILS